MSLLVLGLSRFTNKDWDGSINLFTTALEQSKLLSKVSPLSIYYYRGLAYTYKGQFDRAISDYELIIKISPKSYHAYIGRAVAYNYKGEFDLAILDFQKSLPYDSNNYVIYDGLGRAYSYKGEFDLAILHYNKAIGVIPTLQDYQLSGLYNARANVYLYKGDFDRSMLDYNKALQMKEEQKSKAIIYLNRGGLSVWKGDYDKALSDFEQVLKINYRTSGVYNLRGFIYRKKKNYDQAISESDKAINADPAIANFYINRGVSYYFKGDYLQMISNYKKSLKFQTDEAKTHIVLYEDGGFCDNRYDYEYIIAEFDNLIQNNTHDVYAYVSRGTAHQRRGNQRQAISDYEQALRLNPDQETKVYVQQALDNIKS